MNKLNLIYFSATGTTQKTLKYISENMGIETIEEYNITQGISEDIFITDSELVIFGVPVYSGRVPTIAIDALNRFKGNSTPAVIVCVYGNRAYDDALLELKNMIEANHFKVLAAGTFVAEHSIFPAVANGRPDEQDKIIAAEFGKKCMEQLLKYEQLSTVPEIMVKGNFPYRPTGNIPLHPKGNSACNECGTCVKSCPTKAIETIHPRKTDKKRCISCARCIKVCPQNARHFSGLLYKIAGKKFVKANTERKEPEMFFA